MEIRDKIFVAICAATLYFCLCAILNSARGAEAPLILLIFASTGAPLLAVFALAYLLMRSAAMAALLASGGVFLLHRQALLGNAEATGYDLTLWGEEVFLAGRLTGTGAQRLATEYALQGAALLAAALLASFAAERLRARAAV